MERTENNCNFDEIPVPEYLPTFAEDLGSEQDTELTVLRKNSSIYTTASEESTHEAETGFKFATPARKVRSTSSLPKLLRILKLFNSTGKASIVKT
jgi:hypothetical protein